MIGCLRRNIVNRVVGEIETKHITYAITYATREVNKMFLISKIYLPLRICDQYMMQLKLQSQYCMISFFFSFDVFVNLRVCPLIIR